MLSFLAAVLAVQNVPFLADCDTGEKAAIVAGITASLIIFCLFCEETAEKWRKYRERVRKLQETVRRLAEVEKIGK